MSDERDTSLDHRTVDWAIDILRMCEPIRCVQGGMWFGRNHNFADATFVDYGAADAFAVAVRELPSHVAEIAELRAQSEAHKHAAQMALDEMSKRNLQLASARKALEGCRTSYNGYAVTKTEQYPDVLASFWHELQRIDRIARLAVLSLTDDLREKGK